ERGVGEREGGGSGQELEYELIDTGVFEQDRYFDVLVEYAKESPEDLLVQITVTNRGPEAAPLHVLPTLWFRNVWSWGGHAPRPALRRAGSGSIGVIAASHPELGERFLACQDAAALLFTENETNVERLFRSPNLSPYVKDGINEYIVHGRREAVNPAQTGTKAAAQYVITVGAGASQILRLRFGSGEYSSQTRGSRGSAEPFGRGFDAVMEARRKDADEFYAAVIPGSLDADAVNVMRQALAGMLWSKQFYYYDVDRWLAEHGAEPFSPTRRAAPRNDGWHHMQNADVISMPDKWEYPWYAAWDLAFHCLALTLGDEDLGKQQLALTLKEHSPHPSGKTPAYEWTLGDVTPPVHAWATLFTYRLQKAKHGHGDLDWLERCFHKLMLNFTWWVN